MKVKIRSIHGHGDASEEYVVLEILQDCNADHYVIADTTFTADSKISNKVRHTHWFYSTALKKGDFIALFTGTGTDKADKRSDDSTLYYRFWGLKTAVWNDDGDGAVLYELNDWKAEKISGTK